MSVPAAKKRQSAPAFIRSTASGRTTKSPSDVAPIRRRTSGRRSGSDGPLCAGLPTSMETPTIDLSLSKILVGMCLDEATALVEGITDGAALRVVRDDGVDLAVTADYSETRVNVAVDGGVITEVVSIG